MELFDKIHVNPKLDSTLAQQIKQQVAWLIASGQLNPGDSLPSVRQMAEHLAVNVNTVRSAYQKLELEGLVETRQGLSTRVLSFDPSRLTGPENLMHSHTIGVVIPSIENPFYHAFLQGVEDIARKDHYLLFVCNTYNDPGAARRYFLELSAKQVDGILVASQNIFQNLAGDNQMVSALPFVSVDRPEMPGYAVLLDLEGAGYQATQHLVEHGHRRVGLITYQMDTPNVRPVNAGYQRALQEAGIEIDDALIVHIQGFDINAGYQAARALLRMRSLPTAVFAITDMLAIGALKAFQEAGLRIPADVALVGFNDIPLAALVNPPLTTVAAPARQMGASAMKMLEAQISSRSPASSRVVLPTSLVVRQSCGLHPSDSYQN